jgi:hypothetical protein
LLNNRSTKLRARYRYGLKHRASVGFLFGGIFAQERRGNEQAV